MISTYTVVINFLNGRTVEHTQVRNDHIDINKYFVRIRISQDKEFIYPLNVIFSINKTKMQR